MQGLVVKSTGSWYAIKTEEHGMVQCKARGKIRTEKRVSTNPIAVGDTVTLQQRGENEYVVDSIEQRKNYLIRKSTKLSKQVHIIAANVDQIMLIVTVVQPKIALGFVDRILATAEAYSIPPILVFNKVDVYNEQDLAVSEVLIEEYKKIGYQCLVTSTLNNEGIDALKSELKDKTTLLVGHSGVGKSSMINRLDPTKELKTKTISKANDKGQHSTTFAEMHFLDEARIIDTPGVRSFGIVDFEPQFVGHYFPEIRARMGDCKYANCQHLNEPQCAVIQAVEEGEIADWRYQNYLDMLLDEGR